MPSRPCLEPGCPNPATYKGRCKDHARQNDRQINRQGRPVYSTNRWKILRRRKLIQNFICERCGERPAKDVHHKHGVAVDPWSIEGLEALCKVCHGKETRQEQLSA